MSVKARLMEKSKTSKSKIEYRKYLYHISNTCIGYYVFGSFGLAVVDVLVVAVLVTLHARILRLVHFLNKSSPNIAKINILATCTN